MKPEVLQAVAHAVSHERSLDVVLKRIVEGLAGEGGAALARVWLRRNPGELCERCLEHPGPPGKISRLHLIASAGQPISSAVRKEDWTRLDGELHWGISKVAQIESDGTPILIKSVQDEQNCVDKPKWARSERIQSFAGYPLIFRGRLLGVLQRPRGLAQRARRPVQDADREGAPARLARRSECGG